MTGQNNNLYTTDRELLEAISAAQTRGNQYVAFSGRNMTTKGHMQLGQMSINRGKYDSMGYGQIDNQGRRYMGNNNKIDCSGLISKELMDNKYQIPTQTTHSLYYNHQKYFDKVDASQAQPGDIVVWRFNRPGKAEEGHTGFIVSMDANKKMTYYGSQSGTGPAMATNTKGVLKDKPFIILRPKASFKKG